MRQLSSSEKHLIFGHKGTLVGQDHWTTLLVTSVIGSDGRNSYRIRRSCSVSTPNSYMCPKLCLPLIFLPLEHGSVWLRISSIPPYFSHMKRLFDYLFNVWPLCHRFLNINSPGADQHERLCLLNHEMQRVVTTVRKLPGLSRFLLPYSSPIFNARPVEDLSSSSMQASILVTRSSSFSIEIPFIFCCRSHRKMFETCQRSSIP